MAEYDEKIITFLFVKHGGWQAVVDLWLYSSETLTLTEFMAVEEWMKSDQAKPHNLQLVTEGPYPHVTLDIELEIPEKD